MRVEERLLKYVSYWTTSDEECRQIPSSERQFELGKVLEQELRDLGLEKVTLTDHCYVYGLLPLTLLLYKEAPPPDKSAFHADISDIFSQ